MTHGIASWLHPVKLPVLYRSWSVGMPRVLLRDPLLGLITLPRYQSVSVVRPMWFYPEELGHYFMCIARHYGAIDPGSEMCHLDRSVSTLLLAMMAGIPHWVLD